MREVQINQKLKFILAGIVLALLLLFVRTDAQAADTSGSCGDNLTWSYESDSGLLTITGYGTMTDYTSSSSAPWYTYRSSLTEVEFDCTNTSTGIEIGTYAFRNCSKITEADISGTVRVGSYAFYGCTSLEELSGTGAIKTVSDHAFYNCKSMSGFDISGMTSIGSYAFYNDTGFTEVTLNAAITEIADYAFQRCMNLESVVALGDLTAIGEGSFYQCYSLNTLAYSEAEAEAGIVYIADTVETIGRYAFYQCASYDEETGTEPAGGISEVVFLGSDVTFTSPTKKTESPFYQCEYLTSITLPFAQTEIAPYLLYECTSLTSVTIPETVTTIGKYAFSGSGLTEVTIPANVAEMGEYTFANSADLAEITFAEGIGLSAIPVYAFSGTGITEITLPDSVESVGNFAFNGCTSLESVTFGSGLTTLGSNLLYSCTQQMELHFTGEYTYLDEDGNTAELSISATAFNGIYAYAYYPADSETWPSGTAVTTSAMYGATSLVWAAEGEEIVVADWYYLDEEEGILYIYPDGNMMNYAQTSTPWYSKRESITQIVFGYNPQTGETHEVTSIGSYAFYGFSAIESVTIPASVTSIGDYAFYKCQDAYSVMIQGNWATGYENDAVLGGLATVVFEEGSELTSIGSYAFANCGYLSEITLPESLREIGEGAFYQCGSSVQSTELPYTIGSGDLSGIETEVEVEGQNNEFIEVRVEGVALGDEVSYSYVRQDDPGDRYNFSFTLSEEYLDSLEPGTYEGYVVFTNYTFAFTLHIYEEGTDDEDRESLSEEELTYIAGLASIDLSNVTSIGDGGFRECFALTDVDFSDSLETIGEKAFYGCDRLTEVTLPDSLQELGSYAFSGCNLTEIRLPVNVSIGSYAFADCTSLTEIVFAEGEEGDVLTLGSYVFSGCGALTAVTLPEEVTTISEGLFDDCSGLTTVVIEGAVTEIAASAFSGCSSLQSITNLSAVTSIADRAFYGCASLSELDLPESLTNDQVGDFAFYSCTGLADENGFIVINGVLYTYVYSSAEEETVSAPTVPENVTEIANYAFYQIQDIMGGMNPDDDITGVVSIDGLIFTCMADEITFEEYAFAGLPTLAEYDGYTATIWYPCTDAEAWEAKLEAHGLTGSGPSLGYSYSTSWSLVAEPNHENGEGTVLKEATCTEEGEISYTCTVCGETYTEAIAATGHSYGEGVVTKEATCIEEGSITYTCTVCGETLTEAIAAAGHSWDEDTVTQEATCTEDGSVTYTCTVCEETYTETIAAAGHSWDAGTETTAATCVDEGEMTYTCTVCGDTYTEVITATGEHDYEGVITKEATCAEAGEKAYICTVCGDVAETEEIAATGAHDYESVVTTEATCTEDGLLTYTCTVCGDTYTETIAAAGHHYEEAVTEPTETEQGYTTYTCTVCGDTYIDNYTDPTGSSDAEDGSGSEDGSGDGSGEEITGGTGNVTAGGGSATLKVQKITVKKTVKKTLKAKKLKKKAQTFKVKAKAKGKVTFKKKSGSKKIKISKKGKVTVKKGTKKGTYKIKVKVTAAKTAAYKKAAKTITVKVTVK